MNKKDSKPLALSVSIVIPVFNDEDHLKKCLDSIAKQTLMPDEVIVVDNNCSDDSMVVAKGYNLVKIVKEKKQGVVFARNKGFDTATGDIIGRIDADTVLLPTWCAQLQEIFASKPNISAVTGPNGYYDLPAPRFTLFLTQLLRGALFYIARPKSKKYLFGSNTALRKEAWQTVRSTVCTDKTIHEDNDLAIHIVQAGLEVTYINKLVVTISARRTDMPIGLAVRYAFGEHRAFRRHGMISIHAWVAGLLLVFLYPWVRFFYRAYSPESKNISIRRVFRHREMRLSPIE